MSDGKDRSHSVTTYLAALEPVVGPDVVGLRENDHFGHFGHFGRLGSSDGTSATPVRRRSAIAAGL